MSATGAPGGSGSRSGSPARSSGGRSRAGSTSSKTKPADDGGFGSLTKGGYDPATWALRPKEGVAKRLELPSEAYFRVSSFPHHLSVPDHC
jgi:hypothetical protein